MIETAITSFFALMFILAYCIYKIDKHLNAPCTHFFNAEDNVNLDLEIDPHCVFCHKRLSEVYKEMNSNNHNTNTNENENTRKNT